MWEEGAEGKGFGGDGEGGLFDAEGAGEGMNKYSNIVE